MWQRKLVRTKTAYDETLLSMTSGNILDMYIVNTCNGIKFDFIRKQNTLNKIKSYAIQTISIRHVCKYSVILIARDRERYSTYHFYSRLKVT